MDWQMIAVFACILASGAFLARSTWRTWFGSAKAGCGSGCGKCTAETTPATKGRRALPQI